jgi:hypothetical protein
MVITPSGSAIDNPSGGSSVVIPSSVPRPNTKRWAYFVADGTAGLPAVNMIGDKASSTGTGTTSGAAATTTLPTRITLATAATTSGATNFSANAASYVFGRNLRLQTYERLVTYTAIRLFMGITDSDLHLQTTANPTGNYAIFRADKSVPDTNYQCITKDGTTQNVIDSGVAIDTNFHRFEIICNDSVPNVKFYIDGNLVATSIVHTPTAAALGFFQICSNKTSGSVAENQEIAWLYIESDF